jgi:hypothetical protein
MLEYFICFLLGMVFMYIFSSIMAVGHSVVTLQEVQKSVAALFLVCEQGIQETLQLKYLAMEEANRSEQNITAQKYIDQMSLDSVRKTVMRNFLRTFPSRYENLLEYKTWEEMESYVNNLVKKGEKI